MKFEKGNTVKFILTGEKVMITEVISEGTIGYATKGYIIRNQYFTELYVKEFEVEKYDEPKVENPPGIQSQIEEFPTENEKKE